MTSESLTLSEEANSSGRLFFGGRRENIDIFRGTLEEKAIFNRQLTHEDFKQLAIP